MDMCSLRLGPPISMLEHPTESQCPGTSSAETAPADKCTTPDRTVNTSPVNTSHVNITLTSPSFPQSIHTSSVLHVNTVDTNPPTPSPPTNPSTLYDLLSPKLLHQHSLLTAVQQLLHPITHLPSIPIDTLAKLHAILRDSPRLASYLPPLPVARHRPTRAPPVSYADPNQPQIGPPPLSPAFPFGTQDGVGIAPSTLTTLNNDAGMGLFGLQPKRSHYAKNAKYHHLFARKGDYICSYHGPLKTPAECITHPFMYIFTDPSDPLGRYIDSWTPAAGVTSYGGYVNEHFQDKQVNCTIK